MPLYKCKCDIRDTIERNLEALNKEEADEIFTEYLAEEDMEILTKPEITKID